MRNLWKRFGITTDPIIKDSVLNIVHKFGHNLDILVIFRVTYSLHAIRYASKLVLDLIEVARKESIQNRFKRSQSNKREQVQPSY